MEFGGEAQDDEQAVLSVLKGKIQLVYISPESLLGNNRFRTMLLSDCYQKKAKGFGC